MMQKDEVGCLHKKHLKQPVTWRKPGRWESSFSIYYHSHVPLLSLLLSFSSLQHIHPSMLPFPPLTIIIEVHLSEDLICPLLWRGFILWHLHHRWHHLVDGLRDRAAEQGRERQKERDRVGAGKKQDKWIQASRDPLRTLSRRELKHNWTEK